MFLSEQSCRDIIIAALHAKSSTSTFQSECASIKEVIQETVDALVSADRKLLEHYKKSD